MSNFTTFNSADELNNQFARRIVAELAQGISKNGRASLVVSGGRTPLGLFKVLGQQTLDWSKVYITLADERWVNTTDDASNEKLVHENLLQSKLAPAHFVGLKNNQTTPFNGAAEAEQALKDFPQPFDVVILGMGDDGHTASLFPGAINLYPALDMNSGHLCMGMVPLTAPFERITLTLPALLNSRHIYLHLVGDDKRQVYNQAMAGNDVNQMPVRAILKQIKVPVDVFWTA